MYLTQLHLWQNIQSKHINDPLENSSTASSQDTQWNIKALQNSHYFRLIVACHLNWTDVTEESWQYSGFSRKYI